MDYAKAHSVTLWCAVLAKANRGVAKLLPKQMTQLQFRLLEQLTLPESEHVRPVRVARLLVLKPSDVDEAVAVLADQGLVRPCEDGCIELTRAGRERTMELTKRLNVFFALCVGGLADEERAVLADLLRRAFSLPGSYYASGSRAGESVGVFDARARAGGDGHAPRRRAGRDQEGDVAVVHRFPFPIGALPEAPHGDEDAARPRCGGLPADGRAYVTTASVRLEEQGYLVRVPDDRDARGILFKLTPQGMLCVQDVADDLYAVLVSMFGEAVEERAVQRALKHLLELEDAALDELGELSW